MTLFLIMAMVIITAVACSIACWFVAKEKNRDTGAWILLGFLGGLVALVALVGVPPLNKQEKETRERLRKEKEKKEKESVFSLPN